MENKPNLNIFDYTSSCIDGLEASGIRQILSIVALVIVGVFALFLVVKMIRGFAKGSRHQLWSTGTVLITIILTIILTRLTISLILNLLSVDTIGTILTWILGAGSKTDRYISILEGLPIDTFRYVISVPATIIFAPFLFMFLYGIIRIIVSIIVRIFKPDPEDLKAQSLLERFSGLCLASVEAILVFSVVILPATSIVGFADDVFNTIADNNKKGKDSVVAKADDFYSEYLEPTLIESPVLWVANSSVNNTIVEKISTIPEISDDNVREEFIDVLEIIIVDIPEFNKMNLKEPSEKEKDAISDLIDKLADNDIITTVVAGTVSAAANVLDVDTLGIKAQPPMDVVIDDVLELLKTCTKETFREDLHLIKDVYFLLADEEILVNIKNHDALLDALTTKRPGEKKTAVQKLIDLINDNERTKALTTTLTKLSITMLTGNLNSTGFGVDATYDDLKSSMEDVLYVKNKDYNTDAERIAAITNSLDENLKDNGITLETGVVENIAKYIDENYSDETKLTDDEFNDILLSYYDAYVEYKNTGKLPGGTEDKNDGKNEDDGGDSKEEEKVPVYNNEIVDGEYRANISDQNISVTYTFIGNSVMLTSYLYGTTTVKNYTFVLNLTRGKITMTDLDTGTVTSHSFAMDMSADPAYVVIDGVYYFYNDAILNIYNIDPDVWTKIDK